MRTPGVSREENFCPDQKFGQTTLSFEKKQGQICVYVGRSTVQQTRTEQAGKPLAHLSGHRLVHSFADNYVRLLQVSCLGRQLPQKTGMEAKAHCSNTTFLFPYILEESSQHVLLGDMLNLVGAFYLLILLCTSFIILIIIRFPSSLAVSVSRTGKNVQWSLQLHYLTKLRSTNAQEGRR